MSNSRWSRSDEWVGTHVDGSYVMVNIETGKYVALNETAHAIWNALETEADAPTISRSLRDRFDVTDEECDAAVSQALGTMQDMKLISQN